MHLDIAVLDNLNLSVAVLDGTTGTHVGVDALLSEIAVVRFVLLVLEQNVRVGVLAVLKQDGVVVRRQVRPVVVIGEVFRLEDGILDDDSSGNLLVRGNLAVVERQGRIAVGLEVDFLARNRARIRSRVDNISDTCVTGTVSSQPRDIDVVGSQRCGTALNG